MSEKLKRRRQSRRTRRTRVKQVDQIDEAQFVTSYQKWLKANEEFNRSLEQYRHLNFETNQGLADLVSEFEGCSDDIKEINSYLTEKLAAYYPHQELLMAQEPNVESKVKPKKNVLESIIFYLFLGVIVFLLGSLLNGQQASGVPRNIGGYAPMTILTGSMERVYPKKSLVIAKVIDPKELVIGEDITYLKENNTTVTHRIVGINEDYLGTGQRGFETKGVENPRKDEEIVRAENVVGKVVFASLLLGEILLFVRENLVLTAITLVVFIICGDVLFKYIKKLVRKEERG